jgi:hypothetical protein
VGTSALICDGPDQCVLFSCQSCKQVL